ncbi:phosphotransferase [Bradyrhizobium jicamae]|uniref:phosphotransferase n=1 Tax=Bradyrhizobium jicamae TaxID=280332 RepID=UPI001BA63012|nr:phosphotransferase [Bradyrhizobium jicamae]MBR0753435.1 phosphotransferase [Bradyrhizobium jicamae]
MAATELDTLPPRLRDAAYAALTEVLGSAPMEAVIPISGGMTAARLFRIDANGHQYLLRLEGTVSPLERLGFEPLESPLRNPHQYVSLRIAAEAGIAPRLHHVNETSRVAVMDFVRRRPLDTYPGGLPALAKALGELRARLQATPTFPHFVLYPDIVARLWAHVCRTGLFASGVLDPATAHLERIRTAYLWDTGHSVSSHNDPVPGNILFDGERLWMIDWESAYRSDPLVDIAIISDGIARTPELETILLQSWLGRAPDDALLARLKLVRALTRLYYADVMLSASAIAPRAAPDTDVAAPTLAEFSEAYRGGRLKAGTAASLHVRGKMYLASFLSEVATPGFDLSV